MERAPLVDSALKVVFCDNGSENSQNGELFRGLFTPRDLEFAFAALEAHPGTGLDVSLDRAVRRPARRNLSATCELVEIAKAVNRLRQSRGVEYLIPNEALERLKGTIQILAGHKRKYDELLDQKNRKSDSERRSSGVQAGYTFNKAVVR